MLLAEITASWRRCKVNYDALPTDYRAIGGIRLARARRCSICLTGVKYTDGLDYGEAQRGAVKENQSLLHRQYFVQAYLVSCRPAGA